MLYFYFLGIRFRLTRKTMCLSSQYNESLMGPVGPWMLPESRRGADRIILQFADGINTYKHAWIL